MSVTAAQLSKASAHRGDIERIVQVHIRAIDDALLRTQLTWGRNCISYALPIAPEIPGLNKKDAQRIVYSTIMRDLEKRKFEVRILLETKKTTIFIAWMTDLDSEEVNAMSAFITAKRISVEEVKIFVETGFAKAPDSAIAVRAGHAKEPTPLVVTEKGRVMKPRGGITSTKDEMQKRNEALADSSNTVGPPGQASAAEAELIGIVPETAAHATTTTRQTVLGDRFNHL